jgi:hypothetical protein
LRNIKASYEVPYFRVRTAFIFENVDIDTAGMIADKYARGAPSLIKR